MSHNHRAADSEAADLSDLDWRPRSMADTACAAEGKNNAGYLNEDVGLLGKDKLLFQLLRLNKERFVPERELYLLAFGLFDKPSTSEDLADRVRNMNRRYARLCGRSPITFDQKHGYKISAVSPREHAPEPCKR